MVMPIIKVKNKRKFHFYLPFNNIAILKCDVGGETLTNKLHDIFTKRNKFGSKFKNKSQISPEVEEWGRKVYN